MIVISVSRRSTLQKTIIFDTVINMKCHPTADEIYSEINKKFPNISKGTVYRNLSLLSSEDKILKISVPNAPDCYDFNLSKHYHLKCQKCGRIFDVKGPTVDISQFTGENEHIIYDYILLFNGVCNGCNKEGDIVGQ